MLIYTLPKHIYVHVRPVHIHYKIKLRVNESTACYTGDFAVIWHHQPHLPFWLPNEPERHNQLVINNNFHHTLGLVFDARPLKLELQYAWKVDIIWRYMIVRDLAECWISNAN